MIDAPSVTGRLIISCIGLHPSINSLLILSQALAANEFELVPVVMNA